VFPHVYALGLRRLREEYDLEPVEYPTTRAASATAAQRARDIEAAFADPSIRAVFSVIGGDDQIAVTRHLDRDLLAAHPKPVFGYSDCTNLLNTLWRCGVVGYHGGSVMVHLGRGGALHPLTAQSLHRAVFSDGWWQLPCPEEFGDETVNWGDPGCVLIEPPMRPAAPWSWHGPASTVTGRSWGGNLEVLSWLLAADRDILEPGGYDGCVLLVETSEELPSPLEVYRMLRNMGERGLLAGFPAVLVGRAKAWDTAVPLSLTDRALFAADQCEAVLTALAEYAADPVVVFDVDFGHTDPQLVIPYGGQIRVDGAARTVEVRY
jgi:muramoyltetrapeptide carboxypeptidase LdcA involved in peptidoglycan recycling